MKTFERVKKILIDHLGSAPEEVREDASLIDDLHADSLDLVELIIAAEEEFDIQVSDEDAERLLTVGDAVKYFARCSQSENPL